MTKYAGMIGYESRVETSPGVWSPVITEVKMTGDVLKLSKSSSSNEQVNEDIILQNRLSVIAGPYAYENFMNIRYATWLGTRWRVTGVEIERPRLIISLGGPYFGTEDTPNVT